MRLSIDIGNIKHCVCNFRNINKLCKAFILIIINSVCVRIQNFFSKNSFVLRDLYWAFVLIFLLNVPLIIISFFVAIERPLINIDYVLCILFFRIPKLIPPLLFLVFVNEAVLKFSSIYHFGILSFVKGATFISNLNLLNSTSLILILAIILIFLFFRLISKSLIAKTSKLAIAVVFVTLAVFDIANGSFFINNYKETQVLSFNLVGSGIKHTVKKLTLELSPMGRVKIDGDVNSANNQLINLLKKHKDRSVLIVIVESMGSVLNSDLDSYIFNSLKLELQKNYKISISKREFKGATTSNELKVLCGLSGDYRNVISNNSLLCIPAISESQGRAAIAIHGFSGDMFSRNVWWRYLGFREMLFKPDLIKKGISNCGGMFSGSCDIETLDVIKEQLIGDPKLVYFLTLNTHLPFVPRSSINDSLAKFCDAAKVANEICLLEAEHYSFINSLSDMLSSLSLSKLPLVVITGDHSPPFIDREKSAQFNQTYVPMVILEPLK